MIAIHVHAIRPTIIGRWLRSLSRDQTPCSLNSNASSQMQQDIERFLNLKNPPGRLTKEQAAWFLGFCPEDITILVARGLLRPLGHPAHNGQKFFLTATLE